MDNTKETLVKALKGRIREGLVVSDKRDKTIAVEIIRQVKHPVGKYVRRRTKVHAHDQANEAKIGDRVRVQECRPLSKTKTWSLVEILNKAQ